MPDWLGQRHFPRYPIVVAILYTLESPRPGKTGAAWTRNLGEGGACLELAERLELSTSLRVLLRTDQGSITGEAQVIWVGEPDPTGGVLHGVTFTRLAPAQHQALRDLLLRRRRVWQAVVRVPLELPVTCQLKGQARPPLQGRTGNISRRGLSLHLPLAIPPGSALEVTLHSSHGPLTVEGTIVRVEPLDAQIPGESIRHGFQFTDISYSTGMTLGRILMEAP
jgi:c-di-GMP-binding flagellar brake protein YcgR